ncbi:hypothetical protein BSKO_05684 [Bryopsis sp. KO-2023]|nr:hypothetical protein BSKO_05684 [Bryopsis sp. KO-2023]
MASLGSLRFGSRSLQSAKDARSEFSSQRQGRQCLNVARQRQNWSWGVTSLRERRRLLCAATSEIELDEFETFVLDLQKRIVSQGQLLNDDGSEFCEDKWDRPAGSGFGITRVLEGGKLLEKAAVNVSIIRGTLTPERAKSMSSRGRKIDPAGGQPYSAAALSLVFHSAHPFIPTLRADIRRFQVDGMGWFGGGADLTPFYIIERDAKEFHTTWKDLCDGYSEDLYPRFKTWCDEYFHIPARKEHRGIGGIFFDDLDPTEENYDVESLVKEVGQLIVPSWSKIATRNREIEFEQRHRDWQILRRGRYLEFNLLYDRGVRFGLQGGRIESIMVSAPPLVSWKYNVEPEKGSPEQELIDVLEKPRDWANL